MTLRRSLPALVAGLLMAGVVVLALAAPAVAAKTPCWKELINDWYDGRIDKSYPAHCYQQALDKLPRDVELYSSARDDINRALQAALTGGGDPPGPNTVIDPPEGAGRDLGGPGSGSGSGNEALIGGEDDKGSPLLDSLRPSNADSIPIPLLVLAGLAMLLLAAAATSFVARRLHARRLPATAAPSPRDPRP